STVGALVGSAAFQRDAAAAHVNAPVLHSHDRWGGRIDEVDYDESYHRVISAAVGHGAHTSAWAEPRVGANVSRAATFLLFALVEPGHACPISLPRAVVAVLRANAELGARWVPRLFSREYSGELGGGEAPKRSVLFGMAM